MTDLQGHSGSSLRGYLKRTRKKERRRLLRKILREFFREKDNDENEASQKWFELGVAMGRASLGMELPSTYLL